MRLAMANKKQLCLEPEPTYFGLQAAWGATKHFGGLKATKELIELCHINKGKVLDVGCGVGITPCYLAKRHGSRVVGVDISERMIDWSNGRAKREGVQDKVEFRMADARSLPFKDALFDAVIGESITAFLEDKQGALSEYVRVTRPGGYIGLNECTWIKVPPPPELVEYLSRITGVKEILPPSGWRELLEGSGLRDIELRVYQTNALRQFIDEIRWLGFRDYLRGWYKFLSLIAGSAAFRKYVREARPPKNISKSYFQYLGYGIYVGRK
jgi:arsenite methyltransferase